MVLFCCIREVRACVCGKKAVTLQRFNKVNHKSKNHIMKKVFTLLTTLLISASLFSTDWDSIEWLGDGAGDGAYANKYKVAVAFGQNVINIQKPGFAAEPGIYTTFPAAISSCSLEAGKYVIEGAGMVLYLSAFTAKETSVAVFAGNVDYSFKVYYADGTGDVTPDPDPDPDPDPEGLTPATYYGTASVPVSGEPCAFEWSITRNANSTLTFEITWAADIVGAVPQICLEGTFTTMPASGKKALYTTSATYSDGATLNNTFFYIAYAGGAAQVDITGYTVGASNQKPDVTGVESVGAATKAYKTIIDGQVVILKNGKRYNALGTEIK